MAINRQLHKESSSPVWFLQEFDGQEDDERFVKYHVDPMTSKTDQNKRWSTAQEKGSQAG